MVHAAIVHALALFRIGFGAKAWIAPVIARVFPSDRLILSNTGLDGAENSQKLRT